MKTSFEVREAVHFWHERLGRHLGGGSAFASLGAAYPMQTAKGPVRRLRIGSGAEAAILIDGRDAIVVENLSVADIGGLQDSPVTVMRNTGATSLRRGVMDWALDPARIYPLLVILPGKASALASLRMSHMSSEVSLCAPGATQTFDANKVRHARDALLAMGKDGRKWRAASQIRASLRHGAYRRAGGIAANKALAELARMKSLFPPSLWLPSQGEPEYEALGAALIEARPGLPIQGKSA